MWVARTNTRFRSHVRVMRDIEGPPHDMLGTQKILRIFYTPTVGWLRSSEFS